MNKHTPAMAAAVIAAALASPAAHAGPAVGLDPTGSGSYSSYADLWTNVTNTALASGFIPGSSVGGGPGFGPAAVPYLSELRSQMVIGTMSNGSAIITPGGLNTGFELSAVVRFEELVDRQTPTSAHFSLPASQSAAMDVDALHAGVQNIAFYFDRYGPGAASKAVPGDGPGTVRCYGAGSTSAGCGEPGDPDGDGLMVMSGHLIFNEANVTTAGGISTGAFDMRFMIDYVDARYLDVVTGAVFQNNVTGAATIPSLYTPATMWDGTPPSGVPLMKFDGSGSFALAVPEPATLALLGLGLAGLALNRRRPPAA
ncbi:PEP-CTERM sorting domain-containing protein [Rugamonas rivuli]|uniref:PEP-CTERM sorting domain-containing protein n=1 Tax=Rugamonas rivuli TaxID=2743358 RepID=A0A843SJ58_9BURK|nr:PEP-CTERM sorting domain-containing protein [Rugamonas rivuli]MQA22110.1 PEP-CTERM sorting domain-containing protein [Rugamonas rivuli]